MEAHRDAEVAEIWGLVRALEVQVARIATADEQRAAQWAEMRPKLDALLTTHQQFSGALRVLRVLIWLVAPAIALWGLFTGHGGQK